MYFQEFLTAQRSLICAQLQHNWHCILPLQKRDETKEIFCMCGTCHLERWKTFPAEGYQRFLNDLASGKIH